jgi:hypothetical protein
VANRLDLFRDKDIGFIDWLDERVLIRLGGLTGVESASGEASVMVQASAMRNFCRHYPRQ